MSRAKRISNIMDEMLKHSSKAGEVITAGYIVKKLKK